MSLVKTTVLLHRSIDSAILYIAFFTIISIPNYSFSLFFQQSTNEVSASQSEPVRATRSYRVKPGDTKFSLARAFDVTIGVMESENPQIKNQLLAGQIITVSNAKDPATMYVVAPGDTKFSLAKNNGISIETLESANPHIKSMLKVGQVLHIPSTNQGNYLSTTVTKEPAEANKEPQIVVKPSNTEGYDLYTVQPDDTLWGLSQKSGLTVPEFLKLNPHVTENLLAGTTVKIPSNSIKATAIVGSNSAYSNLLSKAVKTKKLDLVLLANSQNGSENDFVKGVNMAIDSLKGLGLNIDFKIQNHEEVLNNASVPSGIIVSNDIKANTIKELNKIAATPIFSNSISYDSPNKNWVKVQPNAEDTKVGMLNFIKQKNGNLIIVSDPKQNSDIQLVESVFSNPSIIKTEENGLFDKGMLTNKLQKNKNNIVLIDSSDPNVFLGVTNNLLTKLNEYQLQLAVLDGGYIPDETLVSTKRYRILSMMYPARTPVIVTNSEAKFLRSYSKRYGQQATEEAIAGFDVTFDSALRLAQNEELTKTFDNSITRQFNLKFQYKPGSNGYENRGIYLYQYDPQVGIREIR